MRGNVLVMIGLAVLFGGLAVFLSRSWLDMQANQRLSELENQREPVEMATLVVADQPLRFGTPVRGELLREIPWPARSVPEGAYGEIAELVSDEERVVLSPIERNEPILDNKLTGPGQRGTLSAVIGEGMRAVTVRVNDIAGVAGFVLPDDRVDVMLTRQTERGEGTAEVLLQGVRVLAVDQDADQRSEEPTLAKAVTLEVNTRSAQKLSLASTVGSLSLVLRRQGETGAEMTHRVSVNDLTASPAYAALGAKLAELDDTDGPVEQPRPMANATIGITRATDRAEYSVPIWGRQ